MTRWLGTDRPGERLAHIFQSPQAAITLVENSDRPWGDAHTGYTLCWVPPQKARLLARWQYGRRVFEARPGVVMLMQPGTCHQTLSVSHKASFAVVRWSQQLVEEFVESLGLRPGLKVKYGQTSSELLTGALARLTQAREEQTTLLQWEELQADALKSFVSSGDAGSEPPSSWAPHARVRIARSYLDSHFAQRVSYADLARETGLGVSQLRHAFKYYFGVTPHVYQNMRRLEEARKRLAYGEAPTRLATELGFADLAHFSRQFRARFGVSPSRYWA